MKEIGQEEFTNEAKIKVIGVGGGVRQIKSSAAARPSARCGQTAGSRGRLSLADNRANPQPPIQPHPDTNNGP